MTCTIRLIGILLLLCSAIASKCASASEPSNVVEMQRLIDSCGYNWTAGYNEIAELSPELQRQRLGYAPSKEYTEWLARQPKLVIDPKLEFPTKFDWRDSGIMTPVKDQGNCGSCWDFAATAAFEAVVKKHDGIEYDLSEQQGLTCNIYGQGASCDGGTAEAVFDAFRRYGAVLESCMPYRANDAIPCSQEACTPVARAQGWTYAPNDVNAIKQIVLRGPVTTGFMVYNDFFSYSSGCYRHTWGPAAAGHIVVILGWDDNACGSGQGAWLCKNSWGPRWGGLGGYFWIKWGDCGIGDGVVLPLYPSAPVNLELDHHEVVDNQGDGDGVIDLGERVNLSAFIRNTGSAWADGIEVILRSADSGVHVIDSIAYMFYISPDQVVSTQASQLCFSCDSTLSRGTRIEFTLLMKSLAGNFWDSLYDFAGHLDTVFFDNMENGPGGWVHGGRLDSWERGAPVRYSLIDADTAHSGTMIWGTNLDGSYRPNGDCYLESPAINCSDLARTRLRFYRWLSSEQGAWDHARIWVNGNMVWENRKQGDHLDLKWTYQDIDISAIADFRPTVKVRFQMLSDYGAELGGWNVDDFAIVGIDGQLLGDACTDGAIDLKDAVYLISYIFIGGPAPDPHRRGDANCDGIVDISDAVYLISYVFSGGAEPGCH